MKQNVSLSEVKKDIRWANSTEGRANFASMKSHSGFNVGREKQNSLAKFDGVICAFEFAALLQ